MAMMIGLLAERQDGYAVIVIQPGDVPLEAIEVSAAYAPGVRVLCDASVRVSAGEMVAVLGPNGSGKSSLVKVLTGLLQPTRGRVQLFGQDLGLVSRRHVARRIAVVPQQVQVAFEFCVRDVVMMGRAPHQGPMLLASDADRGLVDEILQSTGLAELADRPVRELSGGEQMLVAIARALAQRPEILMLDEATAHLDIRHSVAVHALVRREIRDRNVACVAVLHDLNEAAQHADRVILLDRGRIRAQGSVADVMTYRALRETFGVDLYVGVNELDGTRYFVPMREVGPG